MVSGRLNWFADEDNIKASDIKEKGNKLSYTVENTTMANGDNVGERLDYYIEEISNKVNNVSKLS